MRNIKLIIEYDGTNYSGWQIQPKCETIQGIIESRMSKITKSEVSIIGSGRTDAGVHALNQVANFETESSMTPDEFKKALNSLLPRDIVVKHAESVDINFHSRFDAISRTYEYAILNSKTPLAFFRKYTYMLSKPIDVELMNEACISLIGMHDFKSFALTGDPVNSYVRNVMSAECNLLDKMSDADWWLPNIIKEQNIILLRIKANAFLRGMVRTIAGTLLEVGIGKMPPERVKDILEMKNRSCAGRSLPPNGLCLVNVSYEK
jgi:tRNA pseudouridine38-40 synthase